MKNRLVITWEITPHTYKKQRETFRCATQEKAEEIVFNRNIDKIKSASYFDAAGEEHKIIPRHGLAI
jgi:hypothetical protein